MVSQVRKRAVVCVSPPHPLPTHAGARFPLMNGIMNAIRRRKSKDAIVLSVVVAVCVAFCIIYILTKRG